MAISTSTKLAKNILEINDTSFRWYMAGILFIWLVDWMNKGWLEEFGISLRRIVVFVFISGILKLLYRIREVIHWFNTFHKDLRSGRIFVIILARSMLFVERVLNVFVNRIPTGEKLAQEFPRLVTWSFSWLLIIYLAFLVAEEFQKEFAKTYLHIGLDTFFIWVIILGVMTIILHQKYEIANQEIISFKTDMGWKNYGFVGILSIVSGFLSYFKLQEFGWIGIVVAMLTSIIIYLLSIFLMNQNKNDEYFYKE